MSRYRTYWLRLRGSRQHQIVTGWMSVFSRFRVPCFSVVVIVFTLLVIQFVLPSPTAVTPASNRTGVSRVKGRMCVRPAGLYSRPTHSWSPKRILLAKTTRAVVGSSISNHIDILSEWGKNGPPMWPSVWSQCRFPFRGSIALAGTRRPAT